MGFLEDDPNTAKELRKIHVFYITEDNKLAGKMLLQDGTITEHKIDSSKYPSVLNSPSTGLAAVHYPNGDVKLWYQTDQGNAIQTLSYADTGGWASETSTATENAKAGTSISAVTWDSGLNGDPKDRLVRIFYVDTNELLAESHWSLNAGWKVMNLTQTFLRYDNPIVSSNINSTGKPDPEYEIMSTDTVGRVFNTGDYLIPNSTADGVDSLWIGVVTFAEVDKIGDPMALALMDTNDTNGSKNYHLLYHGTGNRLMDLVWDGKNVQIPREIEI